MGDFTQIDKVIFPRDVINETFYFLRNVGAQGYEAAGLFLGKSYKNTFNVIRLYIPEQQTFKTENGLMYKVDGNELNLLYDWLFEYQQSLFAQIHTHPTHAYHSELDDKKCIVTKIGGLSIVIPNFAIDPINIDNWAVYRLYRTRGWIRINRKQTRELIKII